LISSINKLKEKLKKRGVRGLMNLHKQFLFNCSNLSCISLGDFIKVLKLQRIDLSKEEYEHIFDRFKHSSKNETNYYNNRVNVQSSQISFLNFPGFIRNFKKILNDTRLHYVEKVFSSLDVERSEMLFIEEIKLKFNSSQHPEVLGKLRSEDEVVTEFLDCFDLNYNLLVRINCFIN
jgi:hypothetical protein